jgi:two-component system, cell cycle sensor histidine kinase and response regulator CckA
MTPRPDVAAVDVERMPLVTYLLRLEPPFRALHVSPQLEHLFGCAPRECIDDEGAWMRRIHPDDRDGHRAALEHAWATHEPLAVEYRVTGAEGRVVWVRDRAVVAPDDEGFCLHGYLVDVTHEKELERELAAERVQAEAFFRDSAVGLAITDAEGRYVRVNEALARHTGYPVSEHAGRTLAELAPQIAERARPVHEQVRTSGVAVHQHEFSFATASGDPRTVLLSVFPLELGGEPHYGRIVVDITAERRAEAERVAAERESRRLIEQLPLVTYVNALDPQRRPTFVSPQIAELYGYPPQAFIDDPGLGDRVIHPDDLERIEREEAAARERGTGVELEYRIVRSDGSIRWVLDLMETVYDHDGTPLFEQGFLIDVTERRESERLFRAVFENAEAVLISDTEGRFVDANPGACELLGRTRDELVGLPASAVVAPSSGFEAVWRSFRETGHTSGATAIVRPGGEQREVEFAAKADVLPGRDLAVLRDVTERRELERELWRAQKLESVGRLAGGVAQDFNNMLTAIRGYAQLLRGRALPGSSEYHHADEIDRASGRAADLTAQLLAFGRRQTLQARAVDINRLVEELEPMLLRLVGDDRELRLELDPALPAAHVDPSQIQQVLLNLVANAGDAIAGGGRIAVRTARAADPADLPSGRYVVVSVEDTGAGLDESALEHLFEPFFTTKPVGTGTGLGLATSYGIARQSGGTIVVSTEPGLGSTFSVFLPEAGAARGDRGAVAGGGGGETILVVEPDPAVRDVVFELLTDAGYRVLTARSGREALGLAERLEVPIELLLTDLGDLRAGALVEALHALRPSLRTLSLPKPYVPDRLCADLRLALDVTVSGDAGLCFG